MEKEEEKRLACMIGEIQKEYRKLSDQERKEFRKYISDTGMEEGRKLWDVILSKDT